MNESKTAWTTRRNDRSDRWRVWKGVGFWTFLALASFTFGLLVVSPLINAAKGSTNDETPQRTVSAPQVQPPAQLEQQPVQAPAPRFERRGRGPELTVTPEKDDNTVQKPETLDSSRAGTDSGGGDASANANATEDSAAGRQGQNPDNREQRSPERRRRSRPHNNDPADDAAPRLGDTSNSERSSGDQAVATRRPRHGKNPDTNAADPGDRSSSGGVQKGEPIDR